jgi:hypothetical protein
MTDRIKGVWVAFEEEMRTDDAESLMSAIRQLRGVVGVQHSIMNADDYINGARIRRELLLKIQSCFE